MASLSQRDHPRRKRLRQGHAGPIVCASLCLQEVLSIMSAVPDFVASLSQLVALPSVSSTRAQRDMSNEPVIDRLASWFETLGFECRKMPVPDNPGKFNLMASKGRGNRGLLLAGHTDTVPYTEDNWLSDPLKLTERDGRFHGLGSTDMKGFFAVVLQALAGMDLNHLQQPVMILATADEESSMSGARALSRRDLANAAVAIVGEPTGLRPVYLHKGVMMESLQLVGRSGHSSNPALGNSASEAMHEAMGLLMQLRQQWQQRWRHAGFEIDIPTLNFGCLHGGDNPNRICERCELQFDVRLMPGMNADNVREDILQQLQPMAERRQIKLSLTPLMPGIEAFQSDEQSPFISIAEQLTGYNREAVNYATEAPFLQSLGVNTLVMGPGDIRLAHQPDEGLDADQVRPAIDVIQKLVARYCLS